MLTATQDARVKEAFSVFDTNKDGRIEKSDFEAKAHEALRTFGETSTSAKGKRVLDAYVTTWEKMLAEPAGVGRDGSLDINAFKQLSEQYITAIGEGALERARPEAETRTIAAALVDLADTDGDGRLSPEEYRNAAQAGGLGVAEADAAFRALDTDGDGHVTIDEIRNAMVNWALGEPEPSR